MGRRGGGVDGGKGESYGNLTSVNAARYHLV